jgi:hypothetical protein
VEKMRPL